MVGIECLTVNPRRASRRWYCDDCVSASLQVGYVKKSYERIAFGDEGGAIACLEWIAEAEAELNYRRN